MLGRWLKGMWSGGEDELGRDDLLRQAVGATIALRAWGARGAQVLPAEVRLVVRAPADRHAVLRRLVDDPAFERALDAELLNRLPTVPAHELPLRAWAFVDEAPPGVTAEAGEAPAWSLRLDGADAVVLLAGGQREWRIGRGPWHGPEEVVANDVPLPDHARWISRRAARIVRAGARLHVEVLDQGEGLVVRRRGGEVIRPARTAHGRVPLHADDRLVFADGGQELTLVVARSAP